VLSFSYCRLAQTTSLFEILHLCHGDPTKCSIDATRQEPFAQNAFLVPSLLVRTHASETHLTCNVREAREGANSILALPRGMLKLVLETDVMRFDRSAKLRHKARREYRYGVTMTSYNGQRSCLETGQFVLCRDPCSD
jgi:hypothetical protein